MKLKRGGLFFLVPISAFLVLALGSCNTLITNQYEATALTILTWQVKYTPKYQGQNERQWRFEEFASNSVLNRNGLKPKVAVTGPDDKGLWWPTLPPKPNLDEIEQRQKSQEKHDRPELLRRVEYEITYQKDGATVTLPTNYSVYRQVARVYSEQKPLKLTFGVNNRSVEQAQPLD